MIEVRPGGRVDSTNVFETKEVAVITPISFEHTAILGDTIEKIAREKAAIITPGCTVSHGAAAVPSAQRMLIVRYRSSRNRRPRVVDDRAVPSYRWNKLAHDIECQNIRIEGPTGTVETRLPLLGHASDRECGNGGGGSSARSATKHLILETAYAERIAEGLASVRWPCRIEVVREDPLVIVDGAHNRDSARRLAETLVEYFACDRALFMIGCGSDKDIDGLAEELAPLAARVIAVRADHPRAMDPQRIAEAFGRLNVDTEIVENVPNGVEKALAATSDRRVHVNMCSRLALRSGGSAGALLGD